MAAQGIRTTMTFTALALALAACSGDQATATRASATQPSEAAAGADPHAIRDADEVYIARLAPLNASTTGRAVTGLATLTVRDGILTVTVETKGLAPSLTHMQHIHALPSCPTAAADANGDGIVDFTEGLPFYGPVKVPLDADISNTIAAGYPVADSDGQISYAASTPVATLEAALGGPLDLADRTIVVHGVAGPLPSSVSPANPAALPVACGSITRIR